MLSAGSVTDGGCHCGLTGYFSWLRQQIEKPTKPATVGAEAGLG